MTENQTAIKAPTYKEGHYDATHQMIIRLQDRRDQMLERLKECENRLKESEKASKEITKNRRYMILESKHDCLCDQVRMELELFNFKD